MHFTKTKFNIKKWLFQGMPEADGLVAGEWDQYAAEWDKWVTKAQKNKIRWFFIETLPDFLYRFVWAYERTVSQLKYKYIWKLNLIKIHSLTATEYHSTGDRLMHGMFQLLVDLVELHKAQQQIVWREDKAPRYMVKEKLRSPEMGIKYLDWEISLSEEDGGPNQAKNAKQIKALHLWWTVTRVNRTDPVDIKGSMGVSTNECYGGDMHLESKKSSTTIWREFAHNASDKDDEVYVSAGKALDDAQAEYDEEDDKMLYQLIKLRKHLQIW